MVGSFFLSVLRHVGQPHAANEWTLPLGCIMGSELKSTARQAYMT